VEKDISVIRAARSVWCIDPNHARIRTQVFAGCVSYLLRRNRGKPLHIFGKPGIIGETVGISHPEGLVGDIVAANLTTKQLSSNIIDSLTNYVRTPQVTVIVTNPSSSDFQLRVRITGAVRSPQSIAYREGMTVLDLVLMAGGPNEFASSNKAKLYRKVNNETKVYPIYIEDILEDGKVETNYPLQPSDIVTIPERTF